MQARKLKYLKKIMITVIILNYNSSIYLRSITITIQFD